MDYIWGYLIILMIIMMIFGTPIFIGYGIQAAEELIKRGNELSKKKRTEYSIMVILGIIFLISFLITGII